MNPLNPTQIWPWGTTRSDSTQFWTLRAQADPKTGRVQIGFIKYIIGLNPNLNPFWGQSDPIGPFLESWGPNDPFEPENWAQNWEKRVGFGQTKFWGSIWSKRVKKSNLLQDVCPNLFQISNYFHHKVQHLLALLLGMNQSHMIFLIDFHQLLQIPIPRE